MKWSMNAGMKSELKTEMTSKNHSHIISLILLCAIYFVASLHQAGPATLQASSQGEQSREMQKSNTHLEVAESLGQGSFQVGAGLSLADNQRAGNAKVSRGERLRQ